MAMVKCKECGAEISSKAEACPRCGAKRPKRTSTLTWVIAGFFGIVMAMIVFGGGSGPTTPSSAAAPPALSRPPTASDLKQEALAGMTIKKFNWYTSGAVMLLDVTIQNNGKRDVKDVEIKCEHAANSGTVIDSNKRTIYESFPAGKAKSIKGFNMGFIRSQVAGTSCEVTDLALG